MKSINQKLPDSLLTSLKTRIIWDGLTQIGYTFCTHGRLVLVFTCTKVQKANVCEGVGNLIVNAVGACGIPDRSIVDEKLHLYVLQQRGFIMTAHTRTALCQPGMKFTRSIITKIINIVYNWVYFRYYVCNFTLLFILSIYVFDYVCYLILLLYLSPFITSQKLFCFICWVPCQRLFLKALYNQRVIDVMVKSC